MGELVDAGSEHLIEWKAMSNMTRTERVLSVLAGETPDRPPVGFWYHFPPDAVSGPASIDAHRRFLERYSVDFLKVMNDNPYPTTPTVRCARDLRKLPVLRGDEDGYGLQLEVIDGLAKEFSGEFLLVTTLFNAWTTLRKIVTPPRARAKRPPVLRGAKAKADTRMDALVAEDRSAVREALGVIAESHANFVAKCLQAGADGIFLSVREDRVNTPELGECAYRELVEPTDLRILQAANSARFNILHACGVPCDLPRLSTYPVHAINWADRAGGPALQDVAGKLDAIICGGVNNLKTLPAGTPDQVAAEVQDALAQAGDTPIIISPGCTFDPDVVPPANLDAMIEAAAASA